MFKNIQLGTLLHEDRDSRVSEFIAVTKKNEHKFNSREIIMYYYKVG